MKAGSVRVWRGLKLNEKYAAKLEARRARQKQKEEEKAKALAAEQARAATSKVNPFSLKASSNAPVNSFGLGAQIFGAAPASPDKAVNNTPDPAGSRSPQSDDEGESSDEDGELLTAMASTILEDSPWKSAPAYSPLYLSTAAEYLPPPPKSRTSPEEAILEEAAEGKNKDGGWKMEGYENSMDLDHVFERFTKRVGYLGEQCIRYELGGVPLPYAGDKVFDQLFPVPSSPYIAVTKGAFTAGNAKRTYSPASIPPCPICKSKRVFECQLMPNLINVLETGATNKTDDEPQTDEERRKEIELTLKKGLRGMQWGTSLVARVAALLDSEHEDELKSLLRSSFGSAIDNDELSQHVLDLMHRHRDDMDGLPFLYLTPNRRPISRPSSRASSHSVRYRPDTPTNSAPSSPLAILLRRPHTPLTSPLGNVQASSYMTAFNESPSSSPIFTHAQFTASLPASPMSSPRILNAKASEFRPIPRPLSAASSNPASLASLRADTPSPDMWAHNPQRPTSKLAIAAPLLPDTLLTNRSLTPSSSLRSSLRPDEDDEEDPFDPFNQKALPRSFHPLGSSDADTQWSNSPISNSSLSADDHRFHYSGTSDFSQSLGTQSQTPSTDNEVDSEVAVMLTDGMTPFDVLSSVFGATLASSELEDALAQNGYDFERAMNWLVDRASANQAAKPAMRMQPMAMGNRVMMIPRDGAMRGGRGFNNFPGNRGMRYTNGRPVSGGNRVCRYFLAGECLRADCRFSHDLERALCRFWLRGTCAKGDACEFLHHLPKDIDISHLTSAMNRADINGGAADRDAPVDEFPALGYNAPNGTHGRRDSHSEPMHADPSRTRFAAAVKRPAPYVHTPQSPPPVGARDPAVIAARREAMGSSAAPLHHSVAIIAPKPSPRVKLRPPTLLPTLPTGDAVNNLYMTYRSRALQLGAARNACLSRAADAWRRGDGAAAKRFSREGHDLNAKMSAEMNEAAGKLVRERAKVAEQAVRNRDSSWSDDYGDRAARGKICGSGLGVCLGIASPSIAGEGQKSTPEERTESMLDLHGLHSTEATEVLEEFLLALEREHFYGIAYLVVGEEKHTGTQDPARGASRARLATGVREWLHHWGYPWLERDGVICVDPLTHSTPYTFYFSIMSLHDIAEDEHYDVASESKRPHSIDLTLELERQLDNESLPPNSPAPHLRSQSRPQSLDPHVLASIVTQLRLNVEEVTKERDELAHLYAEAQASQSEMKAALDAVSERCLALESQLAIAIEKQQEDADAVTMLRGKLEDSRRALMRLQTESRRMSQVSNLTIDSNRASHAAFSGLPSGKRASFTPLTGSPAHRRIASVSDSGIAMNSPDFMNGPSSPPPNRRVSSFFGRGTLPLDLPAAADLSEVEEMRKELQAIKEQLEETRHDLTESQEAREASDTCVNALRTFISEHSIGLGPVPSPKGAGASVAPDSASKWSFKLWKTESAPPAPTSAQVSSPAPSITGPTSAAPSRFGSFFSSSRGSVSSTTSSFRLEHPPPQHKQQEPICNGSDTSSLDDVTTEPVSPASEAARPNVMVRGNEEMSERLVHSVVPQEDGKVVAPSISDDYMPIVRCVKKGCAAICPDGSLTTGKGNRFVLANTEVLHDKITLLAGRVRELEDALQEAHADRSKDTHPLLAPELLQIKRPLERESSDPPKEVEVDPAEAIDNFYLVRVRSISESGHTNFFGTTANAWYLLQNQEGDRDSGRWNLAPDETFKRRSLLWELFTYDAWQCLTFGRPPSFFMPYIDCQMAHETTKTEQGETEMSFHAWKHRFSSRCLSVVQEVAFGARPASYKAIQDLDKKVRSFYTPPSLCVPGFGGAKMPDIGAPPPSVELTMQRYTAFSIREITIFYLHRGFFAKAIEDHPEDPLGSKYAPSFLAAYNSACSFAGLIRSLYSQYPGLTERLWFLFTHVFSCAIVLGSIPTRCPTMALARSALSHLDSACGLFEDASRNARAAKVLPVLRKLKARAMLAMADQQTRLSPVNRLSPEGSGGKEDEEFAALGGGTRLVARKSPSVPSSPQGVVPPVETPLMHHAPMVPSSSHESPPQNGGDNGHSQHSQSPPTSWTGYPQHHQSQQPQPQQQQQQPAELYEFSGYHNMVPEIPEQWHDTPGYAHAMDPTAMIMDTMPVHYGMYGHQVPMGGHGYAPVQSPVDSPVHMRGNHADPDASWRNLFAQFNQA
ncbi:hypothetical protein EUX98_g1823 [Antrodiella citrinella]|uniref:Uncharacterized protein n=1 Tax=Antrodiella citrinella TaxID=2447956 RepID=A0A4S4N0I4_9APHY|nr:hypothetical protein EUX98_g1823 [Antrodiella citrinella]